MSKHIFSKIAKIGEEVREIQLSQELINVELFDAKQASADRNKAFTAAGAGYDMIQKAKANFQKSIFACDAYISKYFKEMQKWPKDSPTAKAYKKAIDDMKQTKKDAENLLTLTKKIPTF